MLDAPGRDGGPDPLGFGGKRFLPGRVATDHDDPGHRSTIGRFPVENDVLTRPLPNPRVRFRLPGGKG